MINTPNYITVFFFNNISLLSTRICIAGLRTCGAPILFSVKPAVCCVYLNNREYITPAGAQLG